jgi:hypothetical protein
MAIFSQSEFGHQHIVFSGVAKGNGRFPGLQRADDVMEARGYRDIHGGHLRDQLDKRMGFNGDASLIELRPHGGEAIDDLLYRLAVRSRAGKEAYTV